MYYEIVTGEHEPTSKSLGQALETAGVYLISIDPDGGMSSYIDAYDYFLIVPHFLIASARSTDAISCIMLRIHRTSGVAMPFSLAEDNITSFSRERYIPTDLTFGINLFIKEEQDE